MHLLFIDYSYFFQQAVADVGMPLLNLTKYEYGPVMALSLR